MDSLHRAIFIDRDGVIIENRDDYVRAWDDVLIFPQALRALSRINDSEYKIVIITNQSAVGRGLISLSTADEISQRLIAEIHSAGGRIDGVFMCPHAPEFGCSCRKPKPGLLLAAAEELSLNLKQSIMIGDALTDIMAGQTAGVRNNIMVLTGRGAEQSKLSHPEGLKPFDIYDSLLGAVNHLFSSSILLDPAE
jgi:histidinol-phosphate phosphatase family protein